MLPEDWFFYDRVFFDRLCDSADWRGELLDDRRLNPFTLSFWRRTLSELSLVFAILASRAAGSIPWVATIPPVGWFWDFDIACIDSSSIETGANAGGSDLEYFSGGGVGQPLCTGMLVLLVVGDSFVWDAWTFTCGFARNRWNGSTL